MELQLQNRLFHGVSDLFVYICKTVLNVSYNQVKFMPLKKTIVSKEDRFISCILFEQDHNYYNTLYCNEINTDLLIKIAMG